MLTKEFIEESKKALLAAKQKLEDDLKGLSAHTELGDDEDSKIQEVEDDEVSRGLIARITSDLEKIVKALAKIDDGTYGIDNDGKEISEARLKALPWADKSIEQK